MTKERKRPKRKIVIPMEKILKEHNQNKTIAESGILDYLDCKRAFYHEGILYEVPRGFGNGGIHEQLKMMLERLEKEKSKKVRWFNLILEVRNTDNSKIKVIADIKYNLKY